MNVIMDEGEPSIPLIVKSFNRRNLLSFGGWRCLCLKFTLLFVLSGISVVVNNL